MPDLLELKEIIKDFGKFRAVNNLNLTIGKGELFGFLGPNGAGKTTTMKIIAGLIRPTSGEVRVDGIDLLKEPIAAKKRMGFVPDSPFIYDKLTGREFLYFIGGVHNLPKKEAEKRSQELLELFQIDNFADELVENYSHGMRQRLTLAGSFFHRPKLFVIDEPTVGLDPQGARLIKSIFKYITGEMGGSVFMSTHTISDAEALCSRIGIIHKGEIIALGTAEEVIKSLGKGDAHLEEVFIALTDSNEQKPLKTVF
ncbi:MAG: ABC transporter ATP-binding protein [Myxococcota bacterium]